METDSRPTLSVKGIQGFIKGAVPPEVCANCSLRNSDFAIATCDGYPTLKTPAEMFKGTYGEWTDVPAQAACTPELVSP